METSITYSSNLQTSSTKTSPKQGDDNFVVDNELSFPVIALKIHVITSRS